MLPQQIATSDFLDILFEQRNKLYGAYELRKGYNKRLTTALVIAGIVFTLLLAFYYFSKGSLNTDSFRKTDVIVKLIDPVTDPEKPIEPPPPPPPPPPVEKIATKAYTTPQIVKEDDVAPEDQPPAVEDLDNKRIGVFTQEGLDDNIIAPPITDNKGVIIVPAQNDADQNKVFIKVEIESAYPGGMNAWKRFLLKTMKYPQRAVEENITGTVVVKFIVDKEGAVSNVQAISGPEALTAEAARVILSSGRWTPAIQNGKHVNSYKEQAINFQLNSE